MTPQNSKRNVILWKIQLNWRIYGRFIAELNYQILKIESKTFDILEHWAVILCASKKNVQWRPKDAWMMLKITNMCLGQWFRNGIRGLKMEWLIFWVLLIWWGGGHIARILHQWISDFALFPWILIWRCILQVGLMTLT